MKLLPVLSPLSKKGLQIIVITAFLYGTLIAVTKLALQFIPGVELRFVAFIAVAAGMCFGPSGAIGAAFGNFIADISYNPMGPSLFISAVLNFFLGYLPFRLWYAIKPDRASLHICSGKTFGKFIIIMGVVALCFAEVLNASISIFYPDAGTENFRFGLLFCNNFLFPVLFGIPAILMLREEGEANYYQPKTEGSHRGYQLHALVLLTVLCSLQYGLSYFMTPPLWMDYGLLVIGIILMAYVSTIPSAYEPDQLEYGKIRLLGSRISFFLLGFATVVVSIYMVMDLIVYFNDEFTRDLHEWELFYSDLQYTLFWVFAVVLVVLVLSEKDMISRISLLADRTQQLAEANKGNNEYGINKIIDKLDVGDEGENPKDKNSSDFKLLFMKGETPSDELEEIDKAIVDMNADIKRYVENLAIMLNEKHALESQLNVANSIQQGMLPDLNEINDRLHAKDCPFFVNGSMKAAKTVGGDMYDCFFIDDDHLVIMVADVSGKGVPASLFMMVTQSLIFNSKNEIDPAVILASTNDALSANNEQALFVTMWMGVVELSTGIIAFANAGHNPPLIGSRNGEARWIKEISGPVLGLMDGMEYKLYFTELKKDERLLLYTDGVNEAENGQGGNDCFYGNDRLKKAFENAAKYEDVLADVHEFVNNAPQSDDMTTLWIERR